MKLGWAAFRGSVTTDTGTASCTSGTALTFDDVSAPSSGAAAPVPSGYQGLTWSGWGIVDAAKAYQARSDAINSGSVPVSESDTAGHYDQATGCVSEMHQLTVKVLHLH